VEHYLRRAPVPTTQDGAAQRLVTYSSHPRTPGSLRVSEITSKHSEGGGVQMTSVIGERESKVTQALQTMGMMRSAYWLSWISWEVMLSFLVVLIAIAFGAACQINFFIKNAFGNVFFTLFTFQLAMCGFAYFVAAFIRKTSTAISLGFAIFLIGFVFQVRCALLFCLHLPAVPAALFTRVAAGTFHHHTVLPPVSRKGATTLLCVQHLFLSVLCSLLRGRRSSRLSRDGGHLCCGVCVRAGNVVQLVVNFDIPYTEDYYKKWGSILTIIFSAMPWCPFAKSINDLGNATLQDSSPGLKWNARYSYCNVRCPPLLCCLATFWWWHAL
jgi:hypothetical protein